MTISRRQLLLGAAGLGALSFTAETHAAAPLPRLPRCTSGGLVPAALQTAVAPPSPPLHIEKLARYVDALPIPATLKPDGQRPDPGNPHRLIDHYRIPMREIHAPVHRDVAPTRQWAYGDTSPAPTIEARSGVPLLIEWGNALPQQHFLPIDRSLHGAGTDVPDVRAVVHLHGAKVPPEMDGFPEDWMRVGETRLCRYANDQEPAILWYHDHAMGIERLNHYAGLFGLYLLRDAHEEALKLPSGAQEIPLFLYDRSFNADGSLNYPVSQNPLLPWVPEVYGDAVLVNGKIFPYLEVEPRAYRLRLVNAANTRMMELSLASDAAGAAPALWQIGTEQGLLPHAVPLQGLTIAPAERGDLVIDFSQHAGSRVRLLNQGVDILEFRVQGSARGRVWQAPAQLRAVKAMPEKQAVRTRTLFLNDYMDSDNHRMIMSLDGKFWRDPISEQPTLDTVEIWEFVNTTEDVHPIHLHLVRFQILDRQQFDAEDYQYKNILTRMGARKPPDANEAGWKDTVRVHPGFITRIIVRFEGYTGRYVWHCHLLEHAANEMMRPFEVLAPPR